MDRRKYVPPRKTPRMMARRLVPSDVPAPSASRRGQIRIVAPSFKARPRLNWRRAFRWPWLRMIVVAGLIYLVHYLLASPTFAIQTVQAVGDAGLPAAVLERDCRCVGDNIFFLQPDAVRRRLTSIPTLVVDDVYGRLPNSVVVQAHFKHPVMIWRSQGGYYLADDQGELIAPAHGPSTLPVIQAVQSQPLKVGQDIDVGAMATVRDLIRYLSPSLRQSVGGFYYSATSGVSLGGPHRRWLAAFGRLTGPALQERVIIFQYMMQHAGRDGVPRFNYADLRYSTPYVRYDSPAALAQLTK